MGYRIEKESSLESEEKFAHKSKGNNIDYILLHDSDYSTNLGPC